MTDKKYWLYLARISGLESRRRSLLLEIFGSPEEVFKAPRERLEKVMLLEDYHINQMINSRKIDFERELSVFEEQGIHFASIEENCFPQRLKEIPDCPHFLFYKGRLPEEDTPSVAIIGSRKCSTYGSSLAGLFAEKLAECGIMIISGMAAGIDGYAHRGALRTGGKTFGILGSGVDICFPKSNMDIYEAMQKDGGIISEYYPGQHPSPYNFPQRNRIIAGLSDCVLVTEACKKSGTSITVGQALEQGKDIFAIPGRIGDVISDGCNDLIKNGAFLATEPEDILENLKLKYEQLLKEIKIKKKKFTKKLDCDEKIVYACLRLLPMHISEIENSTGINTEKLSGILMNLILKDLVSEVGTNIYVKKS